MFNYIFRVIIEIRNSGNNMERKLCELYFSILMDYTDINGLYIVLQNGACRTFDGFVSGGELGGAYCFHIQAAFCAATIAMVIIFYYSITVNRNTAQ